MPPKEKECTKHEHCSANKRCVGHTCQNDCARLCNAELHCRIVNHIAVCRCNAGYKRIPYLGMEFNAADRFLVYIDSAYKFPLFITGSSKCISWNWIKNNMCFSWKKIIYAIVKVIPIPRKYWSHGAHMIFIWKFSCMYNIKR